jgi:hypothetical protein
VTVRRELIMKVDSLEDLEAAFAQWRRMKKHTREAVPAELLARARRSTKKHGVTAVLRATRVRRWRLLGRSRQEAAGKTPRRAKAASKGVARFSRLELSAPSEPMVRPLAEVETGTGVRLRVFEQTPEMLRLLSAACGLGGGR